MGDKNRFQVRMGMGIIIMFESGYGYSHTKHDGHGYRYGYDFLEMGMDAGMAQPTSNSCPRPSLAV